MVMTMAVHRLKTVAADGQSWLCARNSAALVNKAAKVMASLARNAHIPQVLRCSSASTEGEREASGGEGATTSFTTRLLTRAHEKMGRGLRVGRVQRNAISDGDSISI